MRATPSAATDAPGAAAFREKDLRSERDDYKLADPSMLDPVDEFGDRIQLQMLTIFPSIVLQQVHNCLAVRQVVPKGTGGMELRWTYFGFADDTPEMNKRRLKQQNLVGPAGLVSMEDGCVGGFVQRGIAEAGDKISVVEMGGRRRRKPGDARHRGRRCAASGRPTAATWTTRRRSHGCRRDWSS